MCEHSSYVRFETVTSGERWWCGGIPSIVMTRGKGGSVAARLHASSSTQEGKGTRPGGVFIGIPTSGIIGTWCSARAGRQEGCTHRQEPHLPLSMHRQRLSGIFRFFINISTSTTVDIRRVRQGNDRNGGYSSSRVPPISMRRLQRLDWISSVLRLLRRLQQILLQVLRVLLLRLARRLWGSTRASDDGGFIPRDDVRQLSGESSTS
ncbi:hypothetical protein L226DRAFT_143976 [Lentinus tigrinus ALCF2SS1-7]|uniref:uncharacterized protein n=1 Tax=Lentinus tigrinus ALCF2SS1-7 TaxID=1328758 RepID=UPI001165FA8D|nr:hypothetical protein L226DRAFT_143976 [Lentinus tigrinus ALCF2SS1-7]